ncbi:MAG: hypothetical protein IBX70_03905 [Clostridia bacterium]|nr:hypothetical protein [Clostridia bacterium]
MRAYGLLFNGKRIFAYYVMLIMGLAMIFGGMISYNAQVNGFKSTLSDDEIIERARGLGMVEIKEKWNGGGE